MMTRKNIIRYCGALLLFFAAALLVQPAFATCGTSNGGTFASAPATNLCAAGTASGVTTNATTYTWTCTVITNGACGTSHGGSFSSAPATNLCSAGSATAVTDTGTNFTWNCNSGDGGTNASCSATKSYNGACASFGGNYGSQPANSTANGCTAGTYVDLADGSQWQWRCNGISGGSNSPTCVANKANCSGGVTWGAGCAGTAASTASGSNTASISNTAGGYTGAATFACNNGSLTVNGGATCAANCSGAVTWGAGCAGTAANTTSGNLTAAINNTAANYTGSAVFSCSNGALTYNSGSCTASCTVTTYTPAQNTYCYCDYYEATTNCGTTVWVYGTKAGTVCQNYCGGGGGGGCFAAGTMIKLADGSQKAIEEIKEGDMVLSFNPTKVETDKLVPNKVVATVSFENKKVIRINNRFTTTEDHKFPIMKDGEPVGVKIGDLKIGDTLVNEDGSLMVIETIEALAEPQRVYNFEVEGNHTYVVEGVRTSNMNLLPENMRKFNNPEIKHYIMDMNQK